MKINDSALNKAYKNMVDEMYNNSTTSNTQN